MDILKASLDHLDAITELWLLSFVFHGQLDPEYYRNDYKEIKQEITNYLSVAIRDKTKQVYISRLNGAEVIGFVVVEQARPSYFDTKIQKVAVVLEIFVHNKCRQSGIGHALINEVKTWAKSCNLTHITLEVSSKNQGALQFYQGLGFVPRQLTMTLAI
jgi:ribosomal protein S18 acetylase RimI-like enzyme